MNQIITRAAAVCIAAAVIFGCVTAASAAETPMPTPSAVDALHGGAPPAAPATLPQTGMAVTPGGTASPPPTFAPPPPEPAATPGPMPEIPALYPADVQGYMDENGVRWIIKTYALSEGENPDGISRDTFEQDGWRYSISDITKKETAAADTREHTETVAVNTDTKDMAEIIALLAPTMEYAADDGCAGILALDLSTIAVEAAGTKTNSYTVSATREYPSLSSNDTSLLPKTITEGGRTLTLSTVDWQTQRTGAADYTELPESYTAIAKYTAAASKTVAAGYVTTAQYKGTLARLVPGKTVYTAYFMGTEIDPRPSGRERGNMPAGALPIAGAAAGAGLLAGAPLFFFLRRNVKVHNLKDGKYAQIGKARVTKKDPVVNLTPFADKAVSGSFILVLDALAAKSLAGKAVTVNYGDRSLQHIVGEYGGEYQFEVDF